MQQELSILMFKCVHIWLYIGFIGGMWHAKWQRNTHSDSYSRIGSGFYCRRAAETDGYYLN